MSGSGGAYTRSDQFGRIIRSFRAAAGPTLMIGGAGSLMPMAAGSAAGRFSARGGGMLQGVLLG